MFAVTGLVKSVSVDVISGLIAFPLQFILMVYLTKVLGIEEYGVWLTVLATISVIFAIEINLESLMVNEVSKALSVTDISDTVKHLFISKIFQLVLLGIAFIFFLSPTNQVKIILSQ